MTLYDNGFLELHEIPQAHPFVMGGIKFAPNLTLSSVGLMDEQVCALRRRILNGYEHAIIPLKAYAREYDKYCELNKLLVVDFIK